MNLRKESLKSHACWDSNPELCDTSAGLEKTNIFFIVTTAGKEKPTKWQDLKTMIIILERHLSPSQSHSQIFIPPAWHCWQGNSRSYSEAMNLIPTKSGMYSFASPNIAAFTRDNARQGLWNISSTWIFTSELILTDLQGPQNSLLSYNHKRGRTMTSSPSTEDIKFTIHFNSYRSFWDEGRSLQVS